jgi:hypothetical protein
MASRRHPWKVNFCKFTNEIRIAMEDATAHSGQTYLAALNGLRHPSGGVTPRPTRPVHNRTYGAVTSPTRPGTLSAA